MDKRRYVARNPRNPKTVNTAEDECCGNIAKDGFSVLSREGMKPPRDRYFERPALGRGLMDENEASFRSSYPSIYDED